MSSNYKVSPTVCVPPQFWATADCQQVNSGEEMWRRFLPCL